MLGLVGIAYGLTPGDIAAVGPYVVSHMGLPLFLVIICVLAILAACYSTIDGASAALSSIVAIDVVHRYWPETQESRLSNTRGTNSIELDALIEQAATEFDPAKRLELIRQSMAVVRRDTIAIPLYSEMTVLAARQGIIAVLRADQQTVVTAWKASP